MAQRPGGRAHTPAYLDPTRHVDARVRDLLGRMTIEEKVRQMSTRFISALVKGGRVSARRGWRNGMGSGEQDRAVGQGG